MVLSSCTQVNRLELLEAKIEVIFLQRDEEVFYLTSDMIPSKFEWDEILVLLPYSNIDYVEEQIGYSLDCISDAIQHHDHFVTLGFYQKKQCVGYVELDIYHQPISTNKKESYFILSKNDFSIPIRHHKSK